MIAWGQPRSAVRSWGEVLEGHGGCESERLPRLRKESRHWVAGCPMSRAFCEPWGREIGIDFLPQKDRSVVTSSRPYLLLKLSRAHPSETVLRTPRSAFRHLELLCSKTASGKRTTSRSPSSSVGANA